MAKKLQKKDLMPDHWILLLDPFKDLLNAYRLILEEERYLVETAINMEEAFRRLSLRHYSVLVTEYLYPLEDTYRMVQWLKQRAPETYVLMVTHADIDETTYETFFDIGVNDIILKPYPPGKILAHIKKGIRQRGFVLEKQEVERQALLDRVTQKIQQPIFNPSYFRKCLRQELKRAKRHKHALSLLVIQIPAEEQIGNRLEHFCTELANILKNHTREEDQVGRENGNFGILLPETDQLGSQAVVKRLARLIQNHSAFQSDAFMKPFIDTLSFQSFTYPERFLVPESLMAVVDEVNKEFTYH